MKYLRTTKKKRYRRSAYYLHWGKNSRSGRQNTHRQGHAKAGREKLARRNDSRQHNRLAEGERQYQRVKRTTKTLWAEKKRRWR